MITLTPKQTEAIELLRDSTTSRVLFGGGAGSAKSWLGAYWLIDSCLKYPGTRWLMGRSVLLNLKRTTFESFLQVAKSGGLKNKAHFTVNHQSNEIIFANDSKIIMMDLAHKPSDPDFDRLGSLELTGAFIDEVSEVSQKAYEIVSSRIRYKLDENGLFPKILATCNPSKGWIYMDFYKPWRDKTLPRFKAFVQATVMDNPYISDYYVQNLTRLSSEVDRQRLLYGNWEYDNDPARLIDYNKIVDLFTNDYIKQGERRYITADIAIHGSDRFVACVWNGWRVVQIVEIDKAEADEIQKRLEEIAKENMVPRSNIIYDGDGIGGYLRGYLRGAIPFQNGGRPVERGPSATKEAYQNLKTQCYFELAKKIQKGEIYIKDATYDQRERISEELSQVKRDKIDRDDKLFLLPKEQVKSAIGRSPDYADALMMRMWFAFRDEEHDRKVYGKSIDGNYIPKNIVDYSGKFFNNVGSRFTKRG